MKWTKAYRKTVGKELTIDPAFEFEKRRNIPLKYCRKTWNETVDAIKKIETIKQKRQNWYIMQRLRKGTEMEHKRDVREVERDITLIRSAVASTSKVEESEMDVENESDCEMVIDDEWLRKHQESMVENDEETDEEKEDDEVVKVAKVVKKTVQVQGQR